MTKRLILWLVLLAAGFLAGLIPQYLKVRRSDAELSDANRQLMLCRQQSQYSGLRDTAAMMYLEATRKNYGNAEEYSRRFFSQVQQATTQSSDPATKTVLENILKLHDPVIAALAKGDPGVLTDLQTILANVEQGTKP